MSLSKKHLLFLRIAAFAVGWLMLVVSPSLAEDKPAVKLPINQGTPEGFEALDAPRITSIDVYYGGVMLGSFRSVYSSKSIAFARPEDILTKIPDIKSEDTPRVIKALTGDLPTNADHICGRIKTEGCNTLKPDVAAVIFYEDQFRVELFLSSAVLATQDTHKDKILPAPPDVYSSVHAFNGGFTDNAGKQQYSMLANSTYAYGAGRLNMVGIASDKQKQINTMAASLDKWGLDNKVGYFDSRATQLLPQTPMSGVSVGTSLNTNLALRDAAGSRLTIFLPQRSYVSIIYNSVIYSTDFYEAGNQVLNTDSLPEGTYEVTIRVRDTNGNITEEKRFFSKNFAIPPEDTPIYFGQLGTIRDTKNNKFTVGAGQGAIAEVGTVQRVTETTGGDANLVMIKNQLYSEAGAFLLLPPDHQLRASVLLSLAEDLGLGISYLGYGFEKKLAIATDLRTIFSGKKSAVPDPVDPITVSSKQWSGSVSYQVSDLANLAMLSSYSQSGGQANKYSYGPQLRYDFWRSGGSNLSMTADTNQTQNGTINSVMLTYTRRLGAWGLNADANRSSGAGTNTKSGGARVTWNDDQIPGRLTVIGAESRRNGSTDSYNGDFEHRSDMGDLKLLGTHTAGITKSNNFYSGNMGFSVVHADDQFTWGGNQQQNSGIVIKNTGNSSDVPMKVLVNNSEQTTFNTGQNTTLFVTPYQTYKVQIKPVQSSSIDYDGGVKNVTLYPGNILPMVWVINRINVVLGHVVLPDGTPLVDARLEESRNLSVTDEEGLFQGELLELNKITFTRTAEEIQPPTPVNKDTDFDIFSILPSTHLKRSTPSNMSSKAQDEALIDLYGESTPLPEGGKAIPDKTPPSTPSEANSVVPEQMGPPAPEVHTVVQEQEGPPAPEEHTVVQAKVEQPPPLPPKKILPEVHCQVTLPESKEINGVYIYSEPLTCTPIPFEKKPEGPEPEKQAYWSPYISPQRVSQFIAPLLEEHTEFAVALLGEELRPARDEPFTTPLIAQAVTSYPDSVASNEEVLNITPSEETPEESARVERTTSVSEVIHVQMGAYRTESQALAEWNVIVSKFSAMTGWEPVIVKVDLPDKGTYYRLRAGSFENTDEAKLFCANLVAAGQPCILPVEGNAQWHPPVRKLQGSKTAMHASILKGGRKLPKSLPEPVVESENIIESPSEILQSESSAELTLPPVPPHAELATPARKKIAQAKLKIGGQEKNSIQAASVSTENAVSETSPSRILVQLGAFHTEAKAQQEWGAMNQNLQEMISKKSYIIRVDLGDKGVYYRLRVGDFVNQNDARVFCRSLVAKGQACILPVDNAVDVHHEEAADPEKSFSPGLGGPYLEAPGDSAL